MPRARWSVAHLVGLWRVRIAEGLATALLAFGLHSRGGGCRCAFTTFTCRHGTSDWERHPRSQALWEGVSAAQF